MLVYMCHGLCVVTAPCPFSFRWVRTRFVLLILFWLGWVGMLAGAIVIIVQAPRCKPIPEMNWWNDGPLYQIPDSKSFSDGIKGKYSTSLLLLLLFKKNPQVSREGLWFPDLHSVS